MATKKTTTSKHAPKATTKGRPPAAARTADGELIAKATKALGCSRGELATRIEKATGRSFFQSRLASANRVDGAPLTEDQREAIKVMVRASKKEST